MVPGLDLRALGRRSRPASRRDAREISCNTQRRAGRDPARASPNRRVAGAAVAGGYLLAVVANFYYMYPVLAGQAIAYTSWLTRMWLSGWI